MSLFSYKEKLYGMPVHLSCRNLSHNTNNEKKIENNVLCLGYDIEQRNILKNINL